MLIYERSLIDIKKRVNIYAVIIIIIFLVIILRLVYLQLFNSEYFKDRSENNLLRTVYMQAPRGIIYDRNGQELVGNRPSFNIEITTEDCPDIKKVLKKLSKISNIPLETLELKVKDHTKRRRFEPKVLIKDIDRDLLAKIVVHKYELPGVIVNIIPTRDYKYNNFASHVIGYIRELNQDQLKNPRFSKLGYIMGDIVGQYGIESKWEEYLQGKKGVQLVKVNANGIRISEESFDAEVPGNSIYLTIDKDVQLASDQALEGMKGAVVALNPNTGEILAMSSAPAFDPNIFTKELSSETWKDLNGPLRKLHNRAIQGAYPPGSVFKAVMAVAGLSEGVITKDTKINCPGYLSFGHRRYHCHKHSGHGPVNLEMAMASSCDVYFYVLGQRLGIDRIHEYARKFGFDRKSGINLFNENPGLIPSTAWKKKYYKSTPSQQKWFPGETLSVAIGQGANLVTPLQQANMIATIVNGGTLYKPYLVKKIVSYDNQFIDDNFGKSEIEKVDVPKDILDTVKASLVSVVNNEKGTGKRARLDKRFNITVGGKSGTSQVISLNYKSNDEKLKDHGWFVGFAPVEKPEIVVAVLAENGGGGGAVAAPIVKTVLEAYFDKKYPQKEENSENDNSKNNNDKNIKEIKANVTR